MSREIALDRSRPFGTVSGDTGHLNIKYEQDGLPFDAQGRLIDKDLSPDQQAALERKQGGRRQPQRSPEEQARIDAQPSTPNNDPQSGQMQMNATPEDPVLVGTGNTESQESFKGGPRAEPNVIVGVPPSDGSRIDEGLGRDRPDPAGTHTYGDGTQGGVGSSQQDRREKQERERNEQGGTTQQSTAQQRNDDGPVTKVEDVNLELWLRGRQKVDWMVLQQRVAEPPMGRKNFKSKKEIAEFLVEEQHLLTWDEVDPALRP